MTSIVEISKKNLRRNLKQLRRLAGGAEIIPVLKANAYGHGLAETAQVLAPDKSIKRFAVFSLEEALALKKTAPGKKILILGPIGEDIAGAGDLSSLELTVYSLGSWRILRKLFCRDGAEKEIAVHLKIETGMNRLGMNFDELTSVVSEAKLCPRFKIVGLFSHLSDVSGKGGKEFSLRQIKKFLAAEKLLKEAGIKNFLRHLSASPGLLGAAGGEFDAVRPGISLYGLWPDKPSRFQNKVSLRPVLSWKTKVVQMKEAAGGDAIGYGRAERVGRKTKVAVLPVGYWDGYDRRLSHIGEVLIGGRRRKILGRICMNLMMIDVSYMPAVKVGDEAALIGRQGKEEITADELAEKIGTINYEVTTRINPLIGRRLVD